MLTTYSIIISITLLITCNLEDLTLLSIPVPSSVTCVDDLSDVQPLRVHVALVELFIITVIQSSTPRSSRILLTGNPQSSQQPTRKLKPRLYKQERGKRGADD